MGWQRIWRQQRTADTQKLGTKSGNIWVELSENFREEKESWVISDIGIPEESWREIESLQDGTNEVRDTDGLPMDMARTWWLLL